SLFRVFTGSGTFRRNMVILESFGAFGGAELHRRVRCLAMDRDLPTVRLGPYFDTRYISELAFQYHQSQVNQHPVADVMPVLLKSGQSASREEAAEKRKPCRSMQLSARRSMEIPDRGPCIFYDCVKHRSHKLPECRWTTRNHIYRREGRNSYQNPPGTPLYIHISIRAMKRGFLGPSRKEPASLCTIRSIDHVSENTIHPGTVHHVTVHPGTVHRNTIHRGTVHHNTIHPSTVLRDTIHRDTIHLPSIDTIQIPSIDTVHPVSVDTIHIPSIDTVHILSLDTIDKKCIWRHEEGRPCSPTGRLINAEGEQSKVEEADTKDPTSASIDSSNSESIDIRTLETIDTNICHRSIPSTIPDATTVIEEVDISDMSSEPIDTPTSTSIDIPTIHTNSCCRSIPLEIPEKSSCPQDIADSTLKSIDVSSCYPDQKVENEITMEDFLELEEFLELEDGQQLGDLDSSEEVIDFLELEEWLGDLDQNPKQKFDDQHTSGKGLENSLKADNIDRHKPDEIDRHPPYDIDLQSPSNIDQHTPNCIDRRPPNCIDRHLCLDELSGYQIEPGTIEEIMHMCKTSHTVPEHLRPPICAEEAVGICKRVKRIHDPVKIMVPCAVFEVESPIPPDKEAYQRGLRFRDEVDEGPAGSPSSDISKSELIDTNTSSSIDTDQIPSIDTRRESEQNEYHHAFRQVWGKKWRNWKKKKKINEGSQISLTPHFSDDARMSRVRLHKSVGKKGRNRKKRKRTKGGSQLPLTPYFSDSIRKSRVRSRCFSQPFAKLKALLIAEMIDKGEGSRSHPDLIRSPEVQGKDPRKTSFHRNQRWLANINRQSIKGIDRHLTVLVNIHIKIRVDDCSAHRPMTPARYQSTALHIQQSIVSSLCRMIDLAIDR
ncbi:hypothetical protein IGI04_019327, partial [Brassica rapa subsp. trilocularis]